MALQKATELTRLAIGTRDRLCSQSYLLWNAALPDQGLAIPDAETAELRLICCTVGNLQVVIGYGGSRAGSNVKRHQIF
jgi:hypothetical protein